MMTDETTTDQLAEIEGQATEYSPPEGWRVLAVGEVLRDGDMWVWPTNDQLRQTVHVGAVVGANQRYIRPIEPEPQPQPVPQPEAEPVQVREGRWRTRGGHYVCVESMSGNDFASIAYGYTWRGCNTPELQWNDNGLCEIDSGERGPMDLVEYLGPIEAEPEPQPESDTELQAQVAFLKGREVTLGTRLQQEREVTTRLRGELESVQNRLGESRQQVTQLEELVVSLRTINEAQEKAFEAAGKENTALRNQLAAVKAELASVAADRQRLRVELDAAQQVPADSPELRQLRADLAEVTQERDQYMHAHELLLNDVNATHARTKAMTVETIAEWLQPIQAAIAAADNVAESTRAGWLAEEVIQHLPSIMRSLTGLDSND